MNCLSVLATGKVNVYIHDCKPAIAGVSRYHLAVANSDEHIENFLHRIFFPLMLSNPPLYHFSLWLIVTHPSLWLIQADIRLGVFIRIPSEIPYYSPQHSSYYLFWSRTLGCNVGKPVQLSDSYLVVHLS